MKNIYLHIGCFKTGTSSIQRFLSKNRSEIQELGFHYLSTDHNGFAHQDFAKSFIIEEPYFFEKKNIDKQSVRKVILDEINATKYENYIISSENFMLACPEQASNYFSVLDNVNIKVILFVREQIELAESVYNQFVKLNKEKRCFNDFMAKLHEYQWLNFYQVCNRWKALIGRKNIIVQKYDPIEKDSIKAFISALNIDSSQLTSLSTDTYDFNQSIGYKALQSLRSIDKSNQSYFTENAPSIISKYANNDLPALMLDMNEYIELQQFYSDSNVKLFEEYLDNETNKYFDKVKYKASERQFIREQIKMLKSND